MKHLVTMCIVPVLLSACVNGIGTISPDAVPKIGKILEKETVITRVVEHTPIYGGFGYRGFYQDPFFWSSNYGSSIREDISYQYKIDVSKNERMTLQSSYNLEVGQCVTIWQIPSSNRIPRVEKNIDCLMPVMQSK